MRKRKIINLMIITTLFVFFLGLNPIVLSAKKKFEEKFEKTVALAKDGKVVLKNVSGNIEVKSWDKVEVRIDALKVSRAFTLSKAKENSQKVKIEVNKEDNSLLIETKYPKTVFKSLDVSVNYTLFIPSEAEIKIKSVSGDVFIENIGGRIKAETVSGNIEAIKAKKGGDFRSVSGNLTLQNINGDLFLKTVSGNIALEKIQGSIEANSVSGDIKIREISKANTVKGTTVSGEIELSEISEANTIKGSSVSGSIIYRGKIDKTGEYTFNTHSGDVRFEIPSDSAFYLEASTFSGSIRSEFEITISGEMKKRKIRGTVNGGGADLSISAFSGDIYLKKI